MLAGLIRGVRLAGKQQHHGPLGIVDQPCEARAVAQQQGRALVGGEAPREPQGEHAGTLRIEEARHVAQLRGTQALALVLALQPLAHARQHARLDFLRRRPVALVRHTLQRAPEFRIAQALAPFPSQLAVEEVHPRLVQEGGHVHAVGHEADRVVLGANLRPLVRAQARRDRAMDAAHAVDVARAIQCQARHVEKARGRRGTRQLQDALDRHPQLAHEIPEVRDHQLEAEGVVAGRHRGMRGEHAVRRHRFERGVERQALRQVFAQQLQDQERRVPFVQVPHPGLHAERAQRAQAADAEDHFLAHPRRLIPAVQAMGDVAIGGDVLRAIGVEQIDRNAAHLRLPQPRDHLAPGDAHRDLEPLPALVHRLDRQIARVALAILGVLHAIVIDGLSEIPLLVQKSHGHEVGALVARRLAVVPGEHAETA